MYTPGEEISPCDDFAGSEIATAMLAGVSLAQLAPPAVLICWAETKVTREGGTDYIYGDSDARRLYIARTGKDNSRVTVFNLDTRRVSGHSERQFSRSAVVSTKSGHGFVSSNPIQMFDSKALMSIKTIAVTMGNPDGTVADALNDFTYILSHQVLAATGDQRLDGWVLGTMDLGGMPAQGPPIAGMASISSPKTRPISRWSTPKTMMVTGHYDLTGSGGQCLPQ